MKGGPSINYTKVSNKVFDPNPAEFFGTNPSYDYNRQDTQESFRFNR
jgi:WD40 repeat protein